MAAEGATGAAADSESRLQLFFNELKRRQVLPAAAAYIATFWMMIEVAATLKPELDLPDWSVRALLAVAIIGSIPVSIFSWHYQLTPEGFRRTAPIAAAATTRWGRILGWLTVGAAFIALTLATIAFLSGRRGLPEPPMPTVAVLPFADLSPEGNRAYFSEGVAEQIITVLAREPGISVIGRTSARQIQRASADLQTIRESLGVTHLLEGSARTLGDELRMSVRLIDTSDGRQVWAEDYRRRLDNIFAVQDEVGRIVAERLRGSLTPAGQRSAARGTRARTYALYLAARAKTRERNIRDLREALHLAQRAIAEDADFALAHALYAELLVMLSRDSYGTIPSVQALALGRPHARRAIQLAPEVADGYAALGLLLHQRPREAIAPLNRAIQLDPSRADARMWLAWAYVDLGDHQKALEQFRLIMEMEPLWGIGLTNFAIRLGTAGRLTEARDLIEGFEGRGGNRGFAAFTRSILSYLEGDLSAAVEQMLLARRYSSLFSARELTLAWSYHLLGLREWAEAASRDESVYTRLFVRGRLEPLLAEVRRDGAALWEQPDYDVGMMALAAARDWRQLRYLYDQRRGQFEFLCFDAGGGGHAAYRRRAGIVAVQLALALRQGGRRQEAANLLACIRGNLARQSRAPLRSPGFTDAVIAFTNAQILSIEGRHAESLRSLDLAVDRGWRGAYTTRLQDYPALDPLRGSSGYARVQAKLDRLIAGERQQVLDRR